MEFQLDKFQEEAIRSIYENLNVLVIAPTGSGKTYIAEKAIEKYLSEQLNVIYTTPIKACLLYTSPSPRDQRGCRMPSSA